MILTAKSACVCAAGLFGLGVVTPPAVHHVQRAIHHRPAVHHVQRTPVPVRDCVIVSSPTPTSVDISSLADVQPTLTETPQISSNPTIVGSTIVPREVIPQDSTVPEPASWMTMIAGFGFIGYNLRRNNEAHSSIPTRA